MAGCVLTAQFWGEGDDGTAEFKFKGPYTDGKTFHISQLAMEAAEAKESSDSDGSDILDTDSD